MKKFVYIVVTVLIGLVVLEIFSTVALLLLWKKKHFTFLPATHNIFSPMQESKLRKLSEHQTEYIVHDELLGWSIKPNGQSSLYSANEHGLRGPLAQTIADQTNKIRIAAFGDSFVHGDEVKLNETWTQQLQALETSIDVLNFGVPGYGTDQSLLRYQRDGKKLSPEIVLIGFMTDNVKRNVNTFRPFYSPRTQIPMTKPRYILRGSDIKLIDNPFKLRSDYTKLITQQQETLIRLSQHDFFYGHNYSYSRLHISATYRLLTVLKLLYMDPRQPISFGQRLNPESEAFHVTIKLLEEFYKIAESNDSTPVIVLFPTIDDLKLQQPAYSDLTRIIRQNNWQVIDLFEHLKKIEADQDISELFAPGLHYSQQGNKLVAQYIHDFLKEKGLLHKKRSKIESIDFH